MNRLKISFPKFLVLNHRSVCALHTSSSSKSTSFEELLNKDYEDKSKSFDFGKWFLFLVPCTTFALGTWQWQRKNWKRGLIHDLNTKTTAEPIPFPENLSDLDDLEYRTILLEGTFDHSKEIYVGPRSLNVEKEVLVTSTKLPDTGGGGVFSGKNPNLGYHVITPFKLADRDVVVLINRGYVPRNAKDPQSRSAGQVEGTIKQVGVLRKSEKKPMFGISNDIIRNNWYFKDVAEMASFANSDAILFDATKSSTVPHGPVGGQTRIDLRDEHVSYMITWYGLSICTLIMWVKQYIKK